MHDAAIHGSAQRAGKGFKSSDFVPFEGRLAATAADEFLGILIQFQSADSGLDKRSEVIQQFPDDPATDAHFSNFCGRFEIDHGLATCTSAKLAFLHESVVVTHDQM